MSHYPRSSAKRSRVSCDGAASDSDKENLAVQHILAKLRKIAKTNLPILLVGERGTETKLLARYIHQESPHRKGPFLTVDCAAMRNEILENELFGYEKGAFTGAYAQRKGRIELAQGGSLFLDDVPKLPLLQQA